MSEDQMRGRIAAAAATLAAANEGEVRKVGMTKQEFLDGVAQIHKEWAKTARIKVDPRYAGNEPSQYTEGIEAVSAVWEDDKRYLDAVHAWMDVYDQSNGRPTKAERMAAAHERAAAKRKGGAAMEGSTEGEGKTDEGETETPESV